MKDQDFQASKLFSHTYKEFLITISLSNPSLLNINVEDNLTFDNYTLYINYGMIETHKDLKYFDEPIQIYQYLTQNVDSVVFEAGFLKFQYMAGKWKYSKPINLLMTKEKISPFEQLNRRLKKAEKNLEDTVAQKNQIIFKLQQKNNQVEKQKDCLVEENQILKSELQELKKQNENLLLKLEDNSAAQSFKYTKSHLKDQNILAYHYNNSHRGYYHITDSTIKLCKPFGGYHNFVNQFRLNGSDSPIHYRVKLERIHQNNLKIGFCTQSGYSVMSNFKNKQSVYYCCALEGSLYCDGKKSQAIEGSKEGDTVTCSINLQEKTFSWAKQNKQIASCEIPKQMRGKNLHFSIIMCGAGDSVTISI